MHVNEEIKVKSYKSKKDIDLFFSFNLFIDEKPHCHFTIFSGFIKKSKLMEKIHFKEENFIYGKSKFL
jgi:hypothetical protein